QNAGYFGRSSRTDDMEQESGASSTPPRGVREGAGRHRAGTGLGGWYVSGENRPAVGDFPAGSQIAGDQIQELIGRGGRAGRGRASDVRLGRQVALKVLAPEFSRDSAFRQRFIRESRSGASVDHPNVIPVFEAGEADGVLFIAMRYVAGRDVRAL